MVDRRLNESQVERLENIFRDAFGRELTLEERKFLGLSVVAVPPEDDQEKPASSPEYPQKPLARKASA